MDWVTLLPILFNMIIIPILGILAKFVVAWISAKTEELKQKTDNELYKKYMDLLEETLTDCVVATNQTYVDSLKAQGNFDAEAQKIAFQKTYDALMQILNEDTIKYLTNALGDFDAYVSNMIESRVSIVKKPVENG